MTKDIVHIYDLLKYIFQFIVDHLLQKTDFKQHKVCCCIDDDDGVISCFFFIMTHFNMKIKV